MNLRLLGIACLVLLLIGAALHSCSGIPGLGIPGLAYSARKGPHARPGTRQLPSLDLRFDDHIESVDFAIEADTLMHLVWTVRSGDEVGILAKRRLWYRRGDLKTEHWSEPLLLLPHAGRGPRIASLGGCLHVIVPDSLKHLVSSDRGMTWGEEPPLWPRNFGLAQSIDVATDSGSLFVAYVARLYGSEADRSRELEYRALRGLASEPPRSVWVTRWTEGEKTSTAWVQSIGEKTPWAPPKLRIGEDGMYLFHTANELERLTKTDSRVTGWLYQSSSKDKGRTWTNPDSSGFPGGIFEFDAAIQGDERFVFREGQGLRCSRWQGGAWSPDYGVAQTNGRTVSINAATRGGKGQLVWIDTRYQRTDQALLNPLAWIPWVSNPGWQNNDVLAAPLSNVLRGSAVANTLQPMRLTKNLSYAEFVCARAEKDRVYVVWSGRSKVGKEITSANRPPEIFYTTLP